MASVLRSFHQPLLDDCGAYYMAATFYSLWGLLLYVGPGAGLTMFPNVVASFSEASGGGIGDLAEQLQGQGLSSPWSWLYT